MHIKGTGTGTGLILVVVILGLLSGCASRGVQHGNGVEPRDDVAAIKAQTEVMVTGLHDGEPVVVDEPVQLTTGEKQDDLAGMDDPVQNAYATLRIVDEVDVEFSRDGSRAWSHFCVEVTYHIGDEMTVQEMDMTAEFERTAQGWQLVGVEPAKD
jgi:hypothetical protein